MIKVNEIFTSLQGESSFSGLPCIFIRLTGCNLRCRWCDTEYAYENGKFYKEEDIARIINSSTVHIAEFTGGEPLLQKEELLKTVSMVEKSKKILIETNGSIPLQGIPERVTKIVDIKLKSSGEGGSFKRENIRLLNKKDEIKFVLEDIFDYNEMKGLIKEFRLEKRNVLISRVSNSSLSEKEIAENMLRDGLNARYQIQLHKRIWQDETGR